VVGAVPYSESVKTPKNGKEGSIAPHAIIYATIVQGGVLGGKTEVFPSISNWDEVASSGR